MTDASLTEVRNYFGMSSAEFAKEWRTLSPESKAQLKAGIGDGTETY